ncbi:hypothetical protein Acsp04_47680 [Actinomadura sp. NBRC 104425]|uniref:hypothetical protein n=1 Tax=Actinomadura sp. NBRC 104425 TaxID=3032204 RepID=UPI0024A482BF|nr:hypothetical protein [Actinomadura sp. NBRC 104425]GLZ14533.1 hypothetical protein Acsp04_47680 [Actinomadura sp. NBRC 104425]
MSFGKLTRRLSALTGIAALAAVAGTAPAGADPAPDYWPLVAVGDETAHNRLQDVVAIGPRNAWAFGRISSDNGDEPLAVRWNGRSWTRVALPTGAGQDIAFADASGPRNVWAFSGGYRGVDPVYALRWNGRNWTVAHRWPGNVLLDDAEVIGPRDVWAFGSYTNLLGNQAWHYDGRRWTEVPTPVGGLEHAHALRADYILAVGHRPGSAGKDLLARWDGRTWTEVDVDVPDLPRETDHYTVFDGVHAVSERDVWLYGREVRRDGDRNIDEFLLLHYDGSTWQRIGGFLPWMRLTYAYALTPDGQGGIWLVPNGSDRPELLHYRDGQWTETIAEVPIGPDGFVLDIANVPNSRIIWAVGSTPAGDFGTWNWAVWRHEESTPHLRQPRPPRPRK